MMTREQLAQRLTERPCRKEIHKVEEEDAKASGLVVVFGASDDLVEFRGAINEELGAYGGEEIVFSKDGSFVPDDLYEHEEWLKEHNIHVLFMEKFKNKITAVWDEDDISWQYRTEIPHSTFKIMEDGEVYCIGIVFNLSDLK